MLHGVFYEGWGELGSWWRHQMETFSASLAICAGSPVTGEFPAQRPVTRSFDVFFDLRLNKRLSKQSWGWWFETPSHPLWPHSNVWTILEWVCQIFRPSVLGMPSASKSRFAVTTYDITHTLVLIDNAMSCWLTGNTPVLNLHETLGDTDECRIVVCGQTE